MGQRVGFRLQSSLESRRPTAFVAPTVPHAENNYLKISSTKLQTTHATKCANEIERSTKQPIETTQNQEQDLVQTEMEQCAAAFFDFPVEGQSH